MNTKSYVKTVAGLALCLYAAPQASAHFTVGLGVGAEHMKAKNRTRFTKGSELEKYEDNLGDTGVVGRLSLGWHGTFCDVLFLGVDADFEASNSKQDISKTATMNNAAGTRSAASGAKINPRPDYYANGTIKTPYSAAFTLSPGYHFSPEFVAYLKAGVGVTRAELSLSDRLVSNNGTSELSSPSKSQKKFLFSYLAGVGVLYKFKPRLFMYMEYLQSFPQRTIKTTCNTRNDSNVTMENRPKSAKAVIGLKYAIF